MLIDLVPSNDNADERREPHRVYPHTSTCTKDIHQFILKPLPEMVVYLGGGILYYINTIGTHVR